MARGRKPTPTALKMLRGNPGKRRLPTDEPRPPVASIAAPDWLPTLAKQHWGDTVPSLAACGLFTEIDQFAWAAACQAWAHARELSDLVAHDGVTFVDEKGMVRMHPALKLEEKWWASYLKISADFGATPRGRVGLHVQHPETDALDAFLQRKNPERFFRTRATPGKASRRPLDA